MTPVPDHRESSPVSAPLSGLRGQCVVLGQIDDLIDRVAEDMTAQALNSIARRNVFHLALSGGNTPIPLYRRLMIDPTFRHFPWQLTHIWIVDERPVPFDDPQSNFGLIRALIVDHVPIPGSHVHPMRAMDPDGHADYQSELQAVLAEHHCDHRLDYVLLGMGADGHTASLFPNSPALSESARWVAFNDGTTVTPPRPRLTMTRHIINNAHRIGILVIGENKHPAIRKVSQSKSAPNPALPITTIGTKHPDAQLTWFLDSGAATGETELQD